MKRSVLMFTLILLVTQVYSQSKDDILDWIVTQVHTHPQTDPDVSNRYEFNVSNDNILVITSTLQYEDRYPFYEIHYINISDISNIVFKEYETNAWMIIYTKNKHKVGLMSVNQPEKYEYDNAAVIILDISITKQNLPTRLKTAWRDYVHLYGGNIKTDLY